MNFVLLFLVALLVSGCSFTWGEGGIGDVLFGGRKAEEIVGQNEQNRPPEPGAASSSAPEEVEGSSLRKVAILPVAWSDGTSGQPCDLCPASVAMRATSAQAARLLTGFIYEAVARHPRFLFPPFTMVEKTVEETPGRSLKAASTQLQAGGRADYVIVSALLELRPRVGDDENPEQPAGAAVYAALLDARSGEVLWSGTFDENESSRGMFLGAYDKVMNDRPVRWSTAQEFSEYAVDELVDDLIDELD